MGDLNVNVRLRPVRFAFMVRPEDKASLRKIFQINTCLWGGVYNPIIPFFNRVPTWWDRQGLKFYSARQIINGYLDYFEPDFIVEATRGVANGFGVDADRILQLADILPRTDERDERGYGQTVLDLYRKLYREKFQFVRRHKHHIIDARAASRTFGDFSACLFGGFPTQSNLGYFAKAFNDAFEPERVTLDAMALLKLYKSAFTSALRMGAEGLEVNYNDYSEPTLFILNAQEPKDLLDFWNYRAVHRDGIAVPVQWLPELSDFCKEFVLANYRPLPGNPHGVMIRPKSLFSRSIPTDDIEGLHAKYLRVDKQGANTLQVWYPPIWQPSPQYTVRRTRPMVTAAEKKFDVPLDIEKPYIRFESLHPDFAARFGGKARWANVIRLRDWSYQDRIATVFPSDFRARAIPRFRAGSEHFLSTYEGLVDFPQFKDIPHSWQLMEGREAIELWLKADNISCRLSESGRTTQQIIQTLGGFYGVRSIAHKGIVTLLDGMARRPIARSAHYMKFQNQISAAIKGDIWRDRVLETLVERKAVELGYELKCSKCGSWGWHALNQLDSMVNCDLCLQRFGFPLASPTDSKQAIWAYRVVGPFALPDFARGGYAAALAIRFFSDVIGHRDRAGTTWSPGQELMLPDGKKVEADFLLWYQRKDTFSTDEATEVVFGEAKSFGKDAFKDQDIERMKLLAEHYPGAALVFATLKEADELSRDEIKRIRKLAEWGREYDRHERHTRAPVIVLTGTELFVPHYLEPVWKDKGGKHKQLAEVAHLALDELKTLADVTQQLYLDMPSYHAWRQAKWEKRRRRQKQATVQNGEAAAPMSRSSAT
jgi:hypothetical protein